MNNLESPTAMRDPPPGEVPVGTPAIEPSWLHPSSLIFELGSHFKQLLIPVVIGIFSAAQGSMSGFFFAVAIFVPAVVYSVFRYFTLRYKIDQGELVVKQGLLFRRVRTVPVSRIQNIDLVQNILHRLFRVAEVRIETASGTEAEATLRVLSMKKLAELRSEIFRSGQASLQVASDGVGVESGLESGMDLHRLSPANLTNGINLLEIPTSRLVQAGLASNRGMLVIGILAGAWYQFDLEDRIDLDEVAKWLPAFDGSLVNILAIVGLVIGILVALRLLGVIWFLLRFFGYRLSLHGEDLRISCGLFTKVSATVPRNRIQFISIHRSLVMRWFHLASIRIETAGGGSQGAENATNTVSRRWFVPVVPENQVSELLTWLRPGLQWNELAIDWKPLATGTARRLQRLAIVQSVVLALIGIAASRPWGWLAGVVALPLLLWWARKKSRAMRYSRTDNRMIYRSGILNRKTSLTFFDKVQAVHVAQSPFDRRWGMATLSIDTAAAGSAEHRIGVRYLDEAFAKAEFAVITRDASRYQPDFG